MNQDHIEGCKFAVDFICRGLNQEDINKLQNILLNLSTDEDNTTIITTMIGDEIKRRDYIDHELSNQINEFFKMVENAK